jgi:hypothetical protein
MADPDQADGRVRFHVCDEARSGQKNWMEMRATARLRHVGFVVSSVDTYEREGSFSWSSSNRHGTKLLPERLSLVHRDKG